MYKFNLIAPGTVYLHGEHIMGYNKTCVAASLNQRTWLSFHSLPPSQSYQTGFIKIHFINIKLNIEIPLHTILFFFPTNLTRTSTDTEFHEKIIDFVNIMLTKCSGTFNPRIEEHQASLQAFVYLLVDIRRKEQINLTSFTVKVWTEVLMRYGLGSSASFVVCLAACFTHWSQLQKGSSLRELDKEKIVEYGSKCDSVIFDSPNTIASNVSVYGSMIIFDGVLQNQAFTHMPVLKILLIFSKVSARSLPMHNMYVHNICKQNMQRYMIKHLDSFADLLFNSIDAISKKCIEVFRETEKLHRKYLNNPGIKKLIQMNQALLKTLSASSPNIDFLCNIAWKHNLMGKLTGKDKGKFMFILLPSDIKVEVITAIIEEFKKHALFTVITDLFSDGVRLE
ncbi:hypothetical protein P5V15_009587 [Pogonomyrmex californicus]